ncbi:MAG: hypothetical protein QOH36_601 [Actinomycetota bacterium]|nr:hypothetical protein [Actinomycetota bacterium]MEA2972703.1 hypothetical protein [Actinomycetota bacterium]
MADWATISSLATAGGTLVLAVATFASVRSATRAARIAEQALLVGVRPVLFPSRPNDISQRIMWGDQHWGTLAGEQAIMEVADGIVYMAISLRNVGAGIAVLRGWRVEPATAITIPTTAGQAVNLVRPDPATFRQQGRDLYVPAGDVSFWQAAIRDPDDPSRAGFVQAIEEGQRVIVDILYGDHEGGQRAISRFGVMRSADGDGTWLCSVVRHWNLDRHDPR